tara:strand:- start:72 stop:662 length:591 start_codon:yes stop_codon:yes gene_type:complete
MNIQIPLLELSETNTKPTVSNYRLYASLLIIPYIWCLPFLSDIGFAENNATSISGFIANAHATGALAALSFNPLILMWEYQMYLLSKKIYEKYRNILWTSLTLYQGFYGSFLVCTVNYVPDWLHTTTVVLFSTAFVAHSCIIMYYLRPTLIGNIDLLLGIISCSCLLFAKGMWFWAFECIGFTSMILFTPIEVVNS